MIRRKHTTKIRGRHVVIRQSWGEILGLRTILMAAAALLLATASAVHSAAHIGFPTQSLSFAGNFLMSPGAPLRPFARQLAEKGRLADRKGALETAEASVRQSPLHSPALSMAGMTFGQENPRQSYVTMKHAVELSRREGLAQLWLINRSVRQGDAPSALRHYDAVLRTMPVSDELFLQLTAIAQVPQGRSALRPYVRADNPWLKQYLAVASSRSPHPRAIAQLLVASPQLPHNYDMGYAGGTLIQRLATEGDYSMMWALFDRLPGAYRASARNFALPPSERGDVRMVPINWAMGSEGDYGATLEKAVLGQGTAIVAFAASGTRGVAARKLARLAAGTYRLSWVVSGQTGNPGAFASIAIGCITGQRRAISRNLFTTETGTSDESARFVMTFSVPLGCPATSAELTIAGGEGSAASEIVIEKVNLSSVASTLRAHGN